MRSKPWFSRAWLGLGSTPSRQSIPTASSGFQGQVEELEARILFSADAAGALIDPSLAPVANDTGSIQQILLPTTADQQQAAPTTQTSASASSTELVFVDARVPDAQTLIAQIVAQQDGQHTLEIHWLDGTQDGVNQISSTLQGRQDISAIHLISHGSDGNVQMGSTWLNEGTLPAYLGQLTSWQSALTQNADILIYGCDVAQTAQGQRFVNDLALLTGADVAASDDKTGAAALGANWDLEYRAGVINAPALLGDGAPQWNHILATVTLRDGLNGYTGTTDTYLALLAPITDYSTSTTLSAGRSTTQDPFQTLFKFENLTGTGANQVPQGSVVTSVSLTLYMTASPTFTNPTFSLYRMLSAWTDTSTYSSMGSGVDGSEYRATEDFSFADNGTGAYSFTFSTAGHAMINTVQAWLNDPSSNQGWYLFCNDNSSKASFASSEDGTAANRPTLAITYSLPSPPSLDLDANNSSGATGSNYTAAFTEQTPIKIADTDATVTAGVNAYNTNLSGMTVTLTNPLDGAAESLTATTTGTNITAAYNSGTGVLTLSGSDTAANYQTVLRSILYNNTSDNPNTTNRSITIVATDPYGGNSATATTTLSVTRVNDAPVITSNGGGATASISLAETLSAVTTVTSTDAEGTARSYSIVAGGDGAKFSINSSTGVLTFVSAPDFEAPTDSNADNVYVVTVQASDGSLSDTQTISVTVTDVSSALVVTTTADTNDSGLGSAFTAEQLNAVTGGSDGKVSLREAIIAANNTAGTDTISFAITGATGSYGEYTITATSALPTVTQAVNIDASTQSGYVAGGVHTVVLDGNDAAAYGLDLSGTADGSTIRGLVIRNFTSYGIYVEAGSDNNTIVGNFIGSFNADGSNKGTGFGNATAGLYVRGANTVIGGTTAADRNVISGNPGGYNIYLTTNADGTTIKGNYIGLNAAGTSVFSSTNPNYGIMIETSATNVTIGGSASGSGNVISGHVREGIWVTTTGAVTVQGNYIGTDLTGTVDLGNTRYGIYLDDTGTATIAGNLISGNDLGGIYASNNSVTVQGNIIGLNAAGTAKLANTGSGIELRTSATSTIGGNGSSYRNVISGNTAYGTDIETAPTGGHVIKGNYIGVGVDGSTLLGNSLAGIYVNAGNSTIGGKTAGDGNLIAGNGGAGIAVASGTGTLYYRNAIYSNTGLGIDLGNDGVTVNDYNDGDGGANYQNNFPVITSVVTNGSTTTIQGSIDFYSGGETIYIELYGSPSADATGYGEGRTYLGSVQVVTTATTGDATFSLTVAGVSVGDWVTAVANIETSYIGASEFSKAVQAVAPANAPRGKVIWNNNDRFFQYYADWSTGGFSGVGTDGLYLTDDISMITAAEAPTRNEIIFIGSADASGKILAAIWNGSTWSSIMSIPLANPSASASNYDSFAVAYDQVSGDAMLVWDNGNTGTTGLSYATWNGSSWSAINTITAPVSGEPLHMKLATRPGSHEMMLAVETNAASNNQYAIVWNGSSWGNAQTLGTNTNEQYFELNVAYEQQSGRAMVVYDNSASNAANVQYRIWNGSSWGSEGTITAPAGITGTADLYSTAMASDPNSNRLALAAKNANDEIWLAVWDGSSWGSTQVATTTGHSMPEDHPSMSVAFESQSGDLLAAYGKSSGPNVYYRTWTSGAGWSAENTGPSIGGTDIPYIVKLYADPYSNTIMMGVQDNAYDLNFAAWDGSAWGTVTELDNDTVFYYRENFTYVWYQNAALLSNLSGDTLAYTEDQSAQVLDQGTAATATMGDESLYNGANLTVSFTAGSTSSEDVLGIRNQGSGAGQIGLSGSNVSYGGTVIGTYSGGSAGASLVITLNANASNAAVTALARNITYQNTNTSTPSTSSRTARFLLTNALGQASNYSDVTITVTATNDAPVNTVPGAQSVNEDTTLVFSSGNSNLISIADVDAGSSNVQVTLTVTNGTLTLSGTSGLSFSTGDGTADTTMTFTGTVSAINTALAGMGYSPTANYNGAASLTILTSDLGNTGSGGTLTDSDTVAITVNAVNDAPVNSVPTAQTTNEDTSLTFSSGNGNLISIADVDAGSSNLQVTLTVTNGTLTLSGLTGLSFTSGDGSADATMTFTGTASAINTALAGLVYAPTANYNGSDTLTIVTSDLGNTGSGGTRTDTDTVAITVTAVNDAPVNTVPAAQSVNEDSTLTFSSGNSNLISIADVDAGSGSMQVTISVSHGALTLSGTTGLSFTSGDGTADTTMTFTGTASAINTALAGLVYAPTANYNGSDTLTILTSDLGNTGSGGTLTDSDTVAITVNAVNDAPSATITPISYNATEQVSLALQGTGLNISDIDAGSGNVQATLSVTSGTLSVSVGSTGVSVSGSSTSTVTLSGTLTQINNLLAGNGGATLSYLINSDAPPASDTLTLLASDLGNTGSGGTLTSADTATIYITAVNDAPTVTITAPSYTVVEAQSVMLHNTGLSVSDPDGNGTSVQVTMSADIGILTISAGSTGVSVGNSGTGSVTLTGTVSQINSLLLGNGGATIAYLNNSGTPTASATLTLGIDDLGNTGGGNLTASANVAINVVPAAAMGSVGIPGVAPGDISAYYGFDASANLGRDDTAGGHDMALIGTPTAETGHDGRTSAIGVTNDETGAAPQTGGNIAGLSTGGAMTVSLWVRFDAFNNASGGNDRIIDFGQAGATGIGNIVLARDATTQRISFILQHDNVTEDICTTGITDVVQTGQWAHIAATVDASGNMRIYFNGTLSGSFSGTALASGVRTNNYIAQSNTAGTYGMNGAIDDLLLVSRAMTAGEIATLYNQANGFSVHEKAGNGTSVGTVVDGSSIDGRTVTYSLTNSAAGRFAINSSTGEITVADGANLLYADASHYTLTVRATDSGGFALDTNYTVNLLNINDAPVGTDHTVAAVEDTPYVFGTSDFGFTDPSDPGANALLAVKITSVPASGSLTLNGVAVSANDVVQASDIAAGKLQFTAAAHANGTGYASFAFKVQDDGGTAHGGTDMDATARTMTIDVASVNDAPQGSDKTVTTLEDTPYVFTNSDFGFSDVDGNAFLAVKITSVPGAGSLTLNGVAVSANDVILASDIAAGRLQLAPATNAHGAGYSSFTFKVQDDGGTANGGVNLDASDRTMTLDVTPVNDAPSGTDKTLTISEDTGLVFSASDFGFTDPDDSPANSLQAVKLTTLPASGTLTLNGSAVSVGQFVSVADINAGLLVFNPAANDNGTAYATLGFQVQDTGGTANGGLNLDASTRTLTIDVTAVNDAPTTQDESVSGNEDSTITGAVSGADVEGSSLSFSKGSDPTHGSVSVAANGNFSYTPGANYNGTDSFTVTVSDGQGGTATSTVTVTINAVNDAPTTTNLGVSGNEDTLVTGQVTASDVDGDPLSFSKASDPAHGSVTVNSDGSFSYTPTANYNGTDSFTVSVADGQGGTSTSTVNITITPVNDLPTTSDVNVSGNEDSAISGQVTGSDVDGNPLSYTKASDPTHGSVSVAANGNFVYTPNANYNGTDSFTVTVSDGQGGTATATVNVTVAAVNDAPTVDNPGVVGAEDTTITGQVTGADVDGDTLSYTRTSNPVHGSVIVNSDGSFSYTPAANFHGSDSFTVTVSDGQGGSVLSTVSITVTPVNDAPTSNNPSVSGAEDTVITGAITASDVEGDTLSYQVSSDPAHGQVTVASDGSFSYTPTANYNGTDSFTVLVSDGQGGTTTSTVSVSITPLNDAPATQNVTASGAEDTAITGQVTASDVDGNPLSYTKGSDPTHGSVTVQANGSFSYTPAANYNGTDSFTVTVTDGQGGSATSTVSITVTAINDAPVSSNVALSGAEDTTLTGQITGSDVDGDTLNYAQGSNPAHGSVTVQTDGRFSYTPAANFSGSDSFTVTVSDGQGGSTTSTVSITVTPVNDAPITYNIAASGAEDTAITGQVAGSDADGDALSYTKGSDPTHGSVNVNSDGSFSYTPTANYSGSDSFTVTVSDGQGGTATSTITITVTPVNDAPVTSDVTASVVEDSSITGQVTGSDAEGDTLSYAKGSDPTHGSVTVNTDGSFSYTPTANYSGTDSFTVTVSDGQGGTATATVTITVTALNDVPVMNNVSLTGAEDTSFTGLLIGNDADGDTLSYAKGSDPAHGSVSVGSNGSFNYTPTANYNGADSFTVTVSDGHGGTATATITLTVTPVNDAPVTSNMAASVPENGTVTGQVTGSDVEGDTLSYAKGSDPTHGSVTVQADGSFSYTPLANFKGTDLFTVTVLDGQGGTATSTVSISVTPVDTTPAVPVVPISPPPASTDNTNSGNAADNTPPDSANTPATKTAPDTTDPAPSSSEAMAGSVATPAQAPAAESDAPATALHDRVQTGAWLGGRVPDNSTMGRQILFDGVSRDYLTPANGSANNGNSPVIQLLNLILPTLERAQDINLMLTPLSGVTHALPEQATADNTGAAHDEGLGQHIRLTKVASYSTGLGLSIGTIWWTARISGLVTSALISTPAWRSLDPLPVVTSPSDDPDHDEDGDSRLGDREVEHLFDGDKPIEQDMPVIQ